MIKDMVKSSVVALAVLAICGNVYAEDNTENTEAQSATFEIGQTKDEGIVYPCPFGWSVEPNPSVDNSLTYTDADESLSISVTSINEGPGALTSPEVYAKVAADQMQCQMPNLSNLIENAYSFECPKEGIEAIVYGGDGEMVLLAISGRNADTEPKVEEFVRFLANEAKNRN